MLSFREKCKLFVESDKVQNFIIALIMLNAVTMGLETFTWWNNCLGSGVWAIDRIFVWFFVLELSLKLYVYRFSFFKSNWNNFDFAIVVLSLIPGNGVFSCCRAVRALRIFRTARLFGRMENLRIIVSAMLRALPNLGWLFLVLMIFFYIFSVLTTTLFSKIAPEQFGSLFTSFYSLFSLMTMEGWQDTVEAVKSPYARWVFIPFMLISSYIFLNLVVGIIVAAMEDIIRQEKKKEQPDSPQDELLKEIRELSQQVSEMKELLSEKKEK
ncbi:MAG: ion transporter [Lentisphaerae bacterium]|nr:ion transporter [Lentisphaerota bacterium]